MAVSSLYAILTGSETATLNVAGSSTIGAGSVRGDGQLIDGVGSDSTSLVAIAADTTITVAGYSNRTILLNKSGTQVTVTLPAATGTGAKFTFVQQLVNTSKYNILALAGDLMCGNILTNSSSDSQSCQPWISLVATSNIRIVLNGTTQGGVSIGDWVELIDIATDTWAVKGLTTSSGTEATPFATS